MGNETLHIENFGPIKKADLKLSKVNLFIGSQGSGKSILAKLFTSLLSDKGLNISPSEKQNHIFQDLSSVLNSYIKENTLIDFNGNGFNAFIDFSTKLNLPEYKPETSFYKTVYIPAERIFIPTVIESSMELMGNNISLPKTLTVFGSYFQKFRKQIDSINIDLLDVRYSYKNGEDTLQLKDNTYISLANAATGMQALIPMFIVIQELSKQDNTIFIIEEPELNLYPTTQKKLVEFFIEKCTKNNNRLFITTHSPYILSSLNNLIQADNALKNNPSKKEEISEIINLEQSVSFDEVSAYYLTKDGKAESIKDNETRLLNAEAIDDVSDIIADVFDKLTDLKYDA